MLERLLLQIIHMSYLASIVIMFVLLARALLKKAPKKYTYILWIVVLLRLVVPISFESFLSIIPTNSVPVVKDIIVVTTPQNTLQMTDSDLIIKNSISAAANVSSIHSVKTWVFFASLVWVFGVATFLIYGVVSLVKVKETLKDANHIKDNIYQSQNVKTPFVIGLIQPKIYLPDSLSKFEKEFIVLHEQTHIKRCDHIFRCMSYFALSLHWFNPMVWIAFGLSGKDMEMSCDESVIDQLGHNIKKAYSQSLLNITVSNPRLALPPLTFFGSDTKGRIKNILSYKSPVLMRRVWWGLIVMAMFLGLITNPRLDNSHFSMTGNGLSELQPLEVTQAIGDRVGSTFSEIVLSPDNYGLTVSANFTFVESEAIRFLYTTSDGRYKTAQLRMFTEELEYYITSSTTWATPKEQTFQLSAYFEALKYLPQEAIWAMTNEKPQRYTIKLSAHNDNVNEDRQIYYTKNGVVESKEWQVRLDIQPLYNVEGTSYHGLGTDIIHVYYCIN